MRTLLRTMVSLMVSRPKPYAFSLFGPAFDVYVTLPHAQQVDLEQALNELEWSPTPADARNLQDGKVWAVQRTGLWVTYVKDDAELALEVTAIVRAD